MALAEEIKLLLVEDDDGHAELVKMNLERSNLTTRILHFHSGQHALDFLEREMSSHGKDRYLMILDINMSGLDGCQVLERLKHNEMTRNIPVIVFSTAENEDGIARCYALGCNFYLAKPVEYTEFSQSVQELGQFIQKAKIPMTSQAA